MTSIYAKIIGIVQKTGIIAKLHDKQSQMWQLRHDLEVYMGIYLTLGIFLGISSIMTTILYFQIMRMRYMMSPACQQAYTRFDASVSGYLGMKWCPAFIGGIYVKIRSFLKG